MRVRYIGVHAPQAIHTHHSLITFSICPHAHMCMCSHNYAYTHTRSRIDWTFTQHYSLSPSLITLINLCTSRTVTHGTPVGQCITRRSHMPWSSSSTSLFHQNFIGLLYDQLPQPEHLTRTSIWPAHLQRHEHSVPSAHELRDGSKITLCVCICSYSFILVSFRELMLSIFSTLMSFF